MAAEPRSFGPYHLVRRLGVGGMAETFEATRSGAGGFEQRVCLKRVLPAFNEDQDLVQRFQREAKLAARLRHTNIVGVVDVGDIDGVQYMALELVDGVDLRSLLKSSPGERLSPETVALIGMDLAHALDHAHELLVHRDISPSNVLVSRSGETKLADFGIAKAIEGAGATASRNARGKVPYMAPEQMRGEAVDGRADLFSLGVVLFEAVTGRRPFDGAHDVQTMQKILKGERLRLDELAPEAPPSLRGIIERLIESDPERRTPSAAKLIEELAEVAPPPATRRKLASNIEQQRGGLEARMHVRAREEERDTELSLAPGPEHAPRAVAPSQASGPPTARRALLLLGALLASLVVTIAGTSWIAPVPRAPEEAPSSAPASAAVSTSSVSIPGPVPATTPRLEPKPASKTKTAPEGEAARPVEPKKATRPSKGWLHVIVEPWGNVWIDGNWMGRAPIKARVSKGRHLVEVGRDLPSERRVVRVGAGARKELEIRLLD